MSKANADESGSKRQFKAQKLLISPFCLSDETLSSRLHLLKDAIETFYFSSKSSTELDRPPQLLRTPDYVNLKIFDAVTYAPGIIQIT